MTTRLLMLSILLTVSCSLAADDSFKNFRIPDHTVLASGVNAGGSYSWSHSDFNNGESKGSNINGSLNGKLFWLKDSDTFRSQLNLSASFSRDREESKFDNSEDNSTGEDVRSAPGEGVSLSWSGFFYPTIAPVGASLNASGYISSSKYQTTHTGKWSSDGVDYIHTEESIHEYPYRNVNLSAGIVYGRVRDATTVYKVRIIEQRLIEEGVLSGELTPATRQQLAGLFYDRKLYSYKHERADRYFWKDIETALSSDPAFDAQAFDSYSLFRMDEGVLGHSWMIRSVGYSVGPVVQVSHGVSKEKYTNKNFTHYSSPDSSGVDTVRYFEMDQDQYRDNVSIGLQAGWHLPLNLNWQFDFSTELYRYVQPENDGFLFETNAAAYYEIADRWRATGLIYHYRYLSDPHKDDPANSGRNPYGQWSLNVDSRLDYYIESRTSLYLNLGYDQAGYSTSEVHDYDMKSNGFNTSIGLSYNFTGYLVGPFADPYYGY